MAQMAISNYLGAIIVMVICYPFVIIGVSLAVYEKTRRSKALLWLNIGYLSVLIALTVMHMQVEIIYGSELLESWYRLHPEDKPQ